jgi:hypothetical protein
MEPSPRPPIFEVHIRPMFRLLDREHMSKWVQAFDLWDLDAVWAQRNEILTRVRDVGDMPGDRYGGPWPPEWIAMFERWIATGSDTQPGHHLVVARPDGDYGVQSVGAEKRRLTAKVTAPTDGCRAWFECDAVTPGRASTRATWSRVSVTARRCNAAPGARGLRQWRRHHAPHPRRGRSPRARDPIAAIARTAASLRSPDRTMAWTARLC